LSRAFLRKNVKSKAHGLHFREGLGIKRADLNLNINLKEVMKKYKVFCVKRSEIYRELSEEVFDYWVKEAEGCNDG
jgi:hypothetical protein